MRFYIFLLLIFISSCVAERKFLAHQAYDIALEKSLSNNQNGVLKIPLKKSGLHHYSTPKESIRFQIFIMKSESGGVDTLLIPYQIDLEKLRKNGHQVIDSVFQKAKRKVFIIHSYKNMTYDVLQIMSEKFWCIEQGFFESMVEIIKADKLEFFAKQKDVRATDFWGVTVEDRVAIIPVSGTLSHEGGLSAKGNKEIIASIEAAVMDDSVDGVVLNVNSPGGQVTGIQGVYNAVKDANVIKPLVTFANHMLCSAAYWGFCSSSAIYAATTDTSYVGSVGVFGRFTDNTKLNEKNGVSYKYITAEQSTKKIIGNPDTPLSEEDFKTLQAEMTAICTAFINDIQAVRGKLPDSTFTGESFTGAKGLELGLVDRIGNLKQAIQHTKNLALQRSI